MGEMPNQIVNERVENFRSIVFIQDYIAKALEEKHISLSDIDSEVHRFYVDVIKNFGHWKAKRTKEQIDGEEVDNKDDLHVGIASLKDPNGIYERVKSALSKVDYLDFKYLNYLMAHYLTKLQLNDSVTDGYRELIDTAAPYADHILSGGKDYSVSKPTSGVYTNIIDIYKDRGLTDEIIMNGHNVYNIVSTPYTMFVVVISGFGNVLSSTSRDVKHYFYRSLIENLFRLYGTDKVVDLPLFRTFTNYSFSKLSRS